METVLIFAGGDTPDLTEEIPEADLVVAADSGYDLAVGLGYAVDVLIGDMDSIAAETIPGHVVVERFRPDKDATDLELALERVAVDRPQRVVVVGGGGGRVDHELAIASLLTSSRWSDIDEIDWITGRSWAYVVRSRREIHGDVGATVSLIPVGGDALGVRTRGLRWNLYDEVLALGTTRGVSNVLTGPVADVAVAYGCLLVVVPSAV